ncbi:hypothetical protein QVD99_005311 [Batrachochytrium dendrobatidis]|nr:hypothetical protein O5D80_004354 [Batrachochytrium dendrobatidis]KAK5668277.1 hypothetical protein QVD99_005311 [Batrachochytrium dendrobatidis]
MFKNEYQGGPSFEIFSSQGSNTSLLQWKLHNKSSIKKQFEKDLKGYCYSCEGLGKLTFPKDDRQKAYLIQSFLVLQICIPQGKAMSIELAVSDLNGNNRRFFLSSAHKEIKATALHCSIPLVVAKRGTWLNFCLDLVSLVSDNYHGQTFRSLDSITLLGNFRLRRIFTLEKQPPDTTNENYNDPMPLLLHNVEPLPKSLEFPFGVSYSTQVLNMHRIAYMAIERQISANEIRQAHSVAIPLYTPLQNIAFDKHIDNPIPSVRKSKSRASILSIKTPDSHSSRHEKHNDLTHVSEQKTAKSTRLSSSTSDRSSTRYSDVSTKMRLHQDSSIKPLDLKESIIRSSTPLKLPPILPAHSEHAIHSKNNDSTVGNSRHAYLSDFPTSADTLAIFSSDNQSNSIPNRKISVYNPELYTDDNEELQGWSHRGSFDENPTFDDSTMYQSDSLQVFDARNTPSPTSRLQKEIDDYLCQNDTTHSLSTAFHDGTLSSKPIKSPSQIIKSIDNPDNALQLESVYSHSEIHGTTSVPLQHSMKRQNAFISLEVLPEIKSIKNTSSASVMQSDLPMPFCHSRKSTSQSSISSPVLSHKSSLSPQINAASHSLSPRFSQLRSHIPVPTTKKSSQCIDMNNGFVEDTMKHNVLELSPVPSPCLGKATMNLESTNLKSTSSIESLVHKKSPTFLETNMPAYDTVSSRKLESPTCFKRTLSSISDSKDRSFNAFNTDIKLLYNKDTNFDSSAITVNSSFALNPVHQLKEICKLDSLIEDPLLNVAPAAELDNAMEPRSRTSSIENEQNSLSSSQHDNSSEDFMQNEKPTMHLKIDSSTNHTTASKIDMHTSIKVHDQSINGTMLQGISSDAFGIQQTSLVDSLIGFSENCLPTKKSIIADPNDDAVKALDALVIFDENGAEQQLVFESDASLDDNVCTYSSIPEEKKDIADLEEVAGDSADETLELEFDEKLNCYRDPLTGKLYDIDV